MAAAQRYTPLILLRRSSSFLTYNSSTSVQDISLMRFVIANSLLGALNLSLSNSCCRLLLQLHAEPVQLRLQRPRPQRRAEYGSHSGRCGAASDCMHLTAAAPVYASLPHFLKADPYYMCAIDAIIIRSRLQVARDGRVASRARAARHVPGRRAVDGCHHARTPAPAGAPATAVMSLLTAARSTSRWCRCRSSSARRG